MTKLTGRQVYSELQIQDEALPYAAGTKMEGKHYHRAIYNGKAFVVSTEVYADWKAGKLAEFNIVETTRELPNAETGVNETVSAFAYGGSIGWTAMKNIVSNETELKVIEAKAFRDLKLDDAAVENLLANA